MQLFNVINTSKLQIWFLMTWIDFSKWKPTWVAEESERLICEIYTKTKFYKIYVVQQLLTNILSKTKKVTAVLEIFSFWQWLIEYSVVLILTSLTW